MQALLGRSRQVEHTREPGGTPLGAQLRELLLHNKEHEIVPMAELLLMGADRAQHVQERIRPALRRGEIVVCERFLDSSVAYQGAADVPLEYIAAVNALATGGLRPDLTLWLDIDPENTLATGVADRIEGRPLAYHQRVRQGYVRMHEQEPERVVRLDVNGQSADRVHDAVMAIVDDRLAGRG